MHIANQRGKQLVRTWSKRVTTTALVLGGLVAVTGATAGATGFGGGDDKPAEERFISKPGHDWDKDRDHGKDWDKGGKKHCKKIYYKKKVPTYHKKKVTYFEYKKVVFFKTKLVFGKLIKVKVVKYIKIKKTKYVWVKGYKYVKVKKWVCKRGHGGYDPKPGHGHDHDWDKGDKGDHDWDRGDKGDHDHDWDKGGRDGDKEHGPKLPLPVDVGL